MSSLAILIPVLARPHRVAPLVASIRACGIPVPTRTVFLCSPGDRREIHNIQEAGLSPVVVAWEAGWADFQRKVNLGFSLTTEEWAFVAADDLVFRPGWFEAAMEVHEATKACVIGVNDQGPRTRTGRHATHFLVHRDYGECGTIDGTGTILSEVYDHSFVDDEFVATARHRGTYAFSKASVFDHLHPAHHKGEMDATYEKGMRRFSRDRATFNQRRRLWR